jgi:hypothetical protein
MFHYGNHYVTFLKCILKDQRNIWLEKSHIYTIFVYYFSYFTNLPDFSWLYSTIMFCPRHLFCIFTSMVWPILKIYFQRLMIHLIRKKPCLHDFCSLFFIFCKFVWFFMALLNHYVACKCICLHFHHVLHYCGCNFIHLHSHHVYIIILYMHKTHTYLVSRN